MCGLNPRSRLVLSELEATENVDPVPVVGTNDMYVSQDSPGITLGITTLQNEPASPTGFELPTAIATIKPSATYRVPMYGKGIIADVIQVPAYMAVWLASCGHLDFSGGSPAGELVTWTPDPTFPRTTSSTGTVTANLKTFTVYDYLARDGSVAAGTKILQAMTGCRVAAIRFNLTVGQWAFAEFDILGQSVQPAAVTTSLASADLDNVRTDFVRSNAAQSEFTIGSAIALNTQSTVWTLDFAAVQEEGDATNAGVACVGVRSVIATGTLNPIQATASIDTLSAAQFAQTLAAYGMNGSMTPAGRSVDAGYTLRLAAPSVNFVFDYDLSGSAVRIPTTARAVSADSTTPVMSLTLS
jgi:hypothetical protein